jgi:hypothetical protein
MYQAKVLGQLDRPSVGFADDGTPPKRFVLL